MKTRRYTGGRGKRLAAAVGSLAIAIVALASAPAGILGVPAESESEMYCTYYWWCGACDPTPCTDVECPHTCDDGCTSGDLNICSDE